MAISKSRKSLRVVLVLLLCLVAWAGYRGWQQLSPEQQWLRAQAGIEAGDYESAEILIKSVLRAKPDHGLAHLAMGKILLQRAGRDGAAATFATQPQAQWHLDRAWKLMPGDPAIRATILEVRVETGHMREAASLAEKVLRDDPENAIALYALTWLAVSDKSSDAASEYLTRLLRQPGEPRLRTLLLNVQLARQTNNQNVLSRALEYGITLVKNPPPTLTPRDRAALDELVSMSIRNADSAPQAEQQLNIALDWLQLDSSDKSATAARALAMASAVTKWYQPGARPVLEKALWPRVRDLIGPGVNWEQPQPQAVVTLVAIAFACGATETGLELASRGTYALQEKEHSDTLRQLHLMAALELIAHNQYSSASVHVAPLMADEQSAGWGCMLAGGIAMTNGQFETALKYHEVAEFKLGKTPFVAFAMGRNLVALGHWDRALKYLRPLAPDFAGDVAELHLLIAQSLLGLGDIAAADRYLRQLRGTSREASGNALQAASLFNEGDPPKALELLQAARGRFPGDRNLAWLQALILLRTERADEGERVIREFAAAHADELASQLLVVRWLETADRNSDALQQVKSLEERFANESTVLLAKAKALLLSGDAAGALEVATQLQSTPVATNDRGIVGASATLHLNDSDGVPGPSETLSAERADLERISTEAGLIQAAVLSSQGQLDEVVRHLGTMLDTTRARSNVVDLLYRSLNTLAEQTSPQNAEAKLDQLLRRHGSEPVLLMAKADLQARQNRVDEALETLGKMKVFESNSARPFILRANLLGQRKEFTKALAELKQALQIEPDNEACRILGAIFALSSQDFPLCLEHTAAGLKSNPPASAFVLLHAAALTGLKRTDEARQLLVALTGREPTNAAGWAALAEVEMASGATEQALQALADGRKHAPTDAALLGNSIAVLCRLQRTSDAMAVAREAAAANPNFATCLQLGGWFRDCSQTAAARFWAGEAIKQAEPAELPQVQILFGELAEVESRLKGGDARWLAEAEKYFQLVLDAAAGEPLRTAMQLKLGSVSLKLGELSGDERYYQAAREYYSRVLEQHPQHLVAGNNLAWLLLQNLHEPEQALAIAEQIREGKPGQDLDLSFVDTMSQVYRKVNRVDDAKRLLTEAIVAHPRHSNLYFELGQVCLDQDPSASREAFRNALAYGLNTEREKEARLRLAELQGLQAPRNKR